MSNRKQTNAVIVKISLSIYLLFIGCNIVDRYIIFYPGYHWETTGTHQRYVSIETKLVKDKPDKGKKKFCNISPLCAGHSKKEHLKWDREGVKLAVECKKNNYKCHPYRD